MLLSSRQPAQMHLLDSEKSTETATSNSACKFVFKVQKPCFTSATSADTVHSPTTSLAADLGLNFHIESGTPGSSSFEESPCVKSNVDLTKKFAFKPTEQQHAIEKFKTICLGQQSSRQSWASPWAGQKASPDSDSTKVGHEVGNFDQSLQDFLTSPCPRANPDKLPFIPFRMLTTSTTDSVLSAFTVKEDSLKRIHTDTLASVMQGRLNNHNLLKLIVVDCRFEYEYVGGHIPGALNLNTMESITKELLGEKSRENVTLDNPIVIFHCEYSQHRAPKLAQYLRSQDRQFNTYPNLCYPDLFILHGGYSQFYDKYSDLCDGGYIRMNDSKFRGIRGRKMHKFRRASKFCRTQSYTFGQDNNSPTPLLKQLNFSPTKSTFLTCLQRESSLQWEPNENSLDVSMKSLDSDN